MEKQRAQAHYQKLHAEGKTDQARADLARLAIVKQNRADAAAKREAERKGLFCSVSIHKKIFSRSELTISFIYFSFTEKEAKKNVKS